MWKSFFYDILTGTFTDGPDAPDEEVGRCGYAIVDEPDLVIVRWDWDMNRNHLQARVRIFVKVDE